MGGVFPQLHLVASDELACSFLERSNYLHLILCLTRARGIYCIIQNVSFIVLGLSKNTFYFRQWLLMQI